MRMIATTLPSLNACSFVSLLQVQQKFFLKEAKALLDALNA